MNLGGEKNDIFIFVDIKCNVVFFSFINVYNRL